MALPLQKYWLRANIFKTKHKAHALKRMNKLWKTDDILI